MNVRTALFAAAAIGSLGLVPAAVNAQTTVTTTNGNAVVTSPVTATTTTTASTTNVGTIESFTPGTSQIIVRGTTGAPVTYGYSKTTTFVDEAGNVVSSETIRPGAPTTVYYTTENGQPVVSKVVVRHAAIAAPVTTRTTETTETTTTTTGHKK